MPPTSNPTRDGKLGIHEVRFMYTPNRNLIIFFFCNTTRNGRLAINK